jgi:adenine deaminase
MHYTIGTNIVDVINRKIFPAELIINGKRIVRIRPIKKTFKNFLIPGLIDSHIHIESSMLVPSEFARLAVMHGTVATVSDPHEIANVLGIEGIKFMHNNGQKVPFKFYFGVPSCVPATDFETSGSRIDLKEIEDLFLNYKFKYLSEVMNFPGVIKGDGNVIAKINLAKRLIRKIDGHAPALSGTDLKKYISSGITTDHETQTLSEGREKLRQGMKLLIREGSAAKSFKDLIPLIKEYPENIMLCTDDLHPDDLVDGHIDRLIKMGIDAGYDFFDLLRSATLNPVDHYNLETGLLRENDPADFVLIDNPENFKVLETYIDGKKVYENGKIRIKRINEQQINKFNCLPVTPEQIKIKALSKKIHLIEAFEGQLCTRKVIADTSTGDGYAISNTDQDILKIVVYNRYNKSIPSVAFIRGFGLKNGAIASTISHDSHNIIATGVSDDDIVNAVNRLIELKGGILFTENGRFEEIQLDIAGLMSHKAGKKIAKDYKSLNQKVRIMGSHLKSPFMTLSFMALLVIPELKLSDRGLFDVMEFRFTDLFSFDINIPE